MYFVALVIQGDAMAKFWPLHHYNKCSFKCSIAKLWDMSHLFVCFVALVIQGGAMAKFWPLHHYNKCMGGNRRKTLSTARGRGGVST